MQKSYKEYAEILSKFGIDGITSEMIEAMEEEYGEESFEKVADLLSVVGQGEYDFESTMTWTPSENGVYAFDVEICDVEEMYTDFFRGISALDKEELDFTNIHEDTSKVNWENGTGKLKVTFEWQNEQFTLEAKVNKDWFDLNVANELNKIIKNHGNGKQLFFASEYQECFVFYRDNEWASEFQQETGLELSDKIN